MVRVYNILICICLGCSVIAAQVQAQPICTPQAFGMYNINIDMVGETGRAAREQGVSEATKTALSQLLSRIVALPDDQILAIDELVAEDAVNLVHIQSETALANRYIARVDICFDAPILRQWLAGQGLAWAETLSPEILILPVWQDPSGARIWQRNNAWLDGWDYQADTHTGLVQFSTLPRLLQNERQIQPDAVLAGDKAPLQQAARLAKAQQILMVHAHLEYGLRDKSVNLRAFLYSREGEIVTRLSEQTVLLDGTVNMLSVFEAFQDNVLMDMEASWKKANLVTTEQPESYIITAEIASLADWRRLQADIRAIDAVRDLSPVQLGLGSGSLRVSIAGSATAFQQAVVAAGYDIQIDSGRFVVSQAQ